MRKYKVKARFSMVVVRDGSNVPVAFDEGQEVELEDDLVALINADLPGYLVKARATPKPKTVETAAGVTENANTRQVTKGSTVTKTTKPKAAKGKK